MHVDLRLDLQLTQLRYPRKETMEQVLDVVPQRRYAPIWKGDRELADGWRNDETRLGGIRRRDGECKLKKRGTYWISSLLNKRSPRWRVQRGHVDSVKMQRVNEPGALPKVCYVLG